MIDENKLKSAKSIDLFELLDLNPWQKFILKVKMFFYRLRYKKKIF